MLFKPLKPLARLVRPGDPAYDHADDPKIHGLVAAPDLRLARVSDPQEITDIAEIAYLATRLGGNVDYEPRDMVNFGSVSLPHNGAPYRIPQWFSVNQTKGA